MTTKFVFIFCLTVNVFLATAQVSSANKQTEITSTTAIYDFDWFIDPELVNRTTFDIPNDGIGGNGFDLVFVSRNLLDSVTRAIEVLVGEKVPSTAKCVYRTDRNGRQISTRNTVQTVGGLPSSTRKKALLAFERDYYADVLLKIGSTRGPIIGDVYGTNVSRLRPFVLLKLKVYDQEKKRVYRNRVRLRNFKKITRLQVAVAGVSLTNRNSLSQEEISEMVFMAIEALRNK